MYLNSSIPQIKHAIDEMNKKGMFLYNIYKSTSGEMCDLWVLILLYRYEILCLRFCCFCQMVFIKISVRKKHYRNLLLLLIVFNELLLLWNSRLFSAFVTKVRCLYASSRRKLRMLIYGSVRYLFRSLYHWLCYCNNSQTLAPIPSSYILCHIKFFCVFSYPAYLFSYQEIAI